MDNKKTCKELIGQELEGRMADLRALVRLDDLSDIGDSIKTIKDFGYDPDDYSFDEDDYDLQDLKMELISEYPLSISKEDGSLRIELSWGGPQDYFILYPNEGTYHYLDWFDGAAVTLDNEDLNIVYEIWGFLLE